jgi:hypothetical protein
MDRPSLAEDPVEQLGGLLAEMTRECLRGKCVELSLFLLYGLEAPMLLEEIEELASDAWAFRDGDDA